MTRNETRRQTVLDDSVRFALAAFNAAWLLAWTAAAGHDTVDEEADAY